MDLDDSAPCSARFTVRSSLRVYVDMRLIKGSANPVRPPT